MSREQNKQNKPLSNKERVQSGLMPEALNRPKGLTESKKALRNLENSQQSLIESAKIIFDYLTAEENIIEEEFPGEKSTWLQKGKLFQGRLLQHKKGQSVEFYIDVCLDGDCIIIDLQKTNEPVLFTYAISMTKQTIVRRPANQPISDEVLANKVRELSNLLEVTESPDFWL